MKRFNRAVWTLLLWAALIYGWYLLFGDSAAGSGPEYGLQQYHVTVAFGACFHKLVGRG